MSKVTVDIQHWNPKWAEAFKKLNVEWLEKFFVVEPIDEKVLSNPQRIIDQGGTLVFAVHDGNAIGCGALKHHGEGVYELTKMAVTEAFQRFGIGAQLVPALIESFQIKNGKLLYLESHSSLKPAIKLYARFGFQMLPHPFHSDYQRSDVYMEWKTPH